MSEIGQQMNFRRLLIDHERVQIPMIQRDYAQGRPSAREVRTAFIQALETALTLPADDPSLPLNLDFIYGSIEQDGGNRFLPLDGQQRLTTLFLLHWYTAWRDGCLEEFREWVTSEGRSRFSYRVRPTSEEYFDALLRFDPTVEPGDVELVSRLVTNQSWYFRYWRLDPTIQSALTMLDAFHNRFKDLTGLYSRLIDENSPAITFQLLPLENFGLSDDLYIKMNARGKPLTEFETFKARYEQELTQLFDQESRAIGNEEFPLGEYFSRRIDTAWADFFWERRDEDTDTIDTAVMNFFRAIVLATRSPTQKTFYKDIPLLRNRYAESSYSLFHSKGWLDKSFSESLIVLLDTWTGSSGELVYQLPDKRYFDEGAVFKKIASDPTGLEYSEIVQLAAFLMFLIKHEGSIDPFVFQDWMRVIFNLSVNSAYHRPTDLQSRLGALRRLSDHTGEILVYLSNEKKTLLGFRGLQVEEEKLKAALILAHSEWRPLLERAEGHAYFRGQIEFLLDFCGVLKKWKPSRISEMSDAEHTAFQSGFEHYLVRAEQMFTGSGILNLGKARWERALLVFGDYLLPSGNLNESFLLGSSTDPTSWKRLLRGAGAESQDPRQYLQQLWDVLSLESPVSDELDQIIRGASDLPRWRQEFLETPEAIDYCRQRLIRRQSGTFYLLTKTKMSGAHAELFTFCLYNRLLPKQRRGEFAPLKMGDYCSTNVIDVEPGIRFYWSAEGIHFELERSAAKYILYVQVKDLEQHSDLVTRFRTRSYFHVNEYRVHRLCEPDEILEAIEELRDTLIEHSSEGA